MFLKITKIAIISMMLLAIISCGKDNKIGDNYWTSGTGTYLVNGQQVTFTIPHCSYGYGYVTRTYLVNQTGYATVGGGSASGNKYIGVTSGGHILTYWPQTSTVQVQYCKNSILNEHTVNNVMFTRLTALMNGIGAVATIYVQTIGQSIYFYSPI